MHDDLTFDAFEARFADAYGRFLADAPVEVDAVQVAAAAVADAARRRTLVDRLARPAWLPQAPRRVLLVATAALLLLAVAASLLLVGSLVNQPPLGGSSHVFLTTGPLDCQEAIRFDVESGEPETVVECANRLRIAPGGTRAAASGPNGIEIIDLADESVAPMGSAAGPFTIPAAWSPRGTWLHWVSCDENTEGCRGFIGQPGSPATREIPEGPSGYNGSFTWSAGEGIFLLWDEETVLAASGEGAGLQPVPGWSRLPLAVSPDGVFAAVAEGRNLGSGELLQSDLVLQRITDQGETRITDIPEGRFVTCAAWSPDGSQIAVAVVHRGTSAVPEPAPTAELLVVTPEGVLEHRWPIPFASGLDCDVLLGRSWSITWSPDSARVLLLPTNVDENPPPDPVLLTIASGEVMSLTGLQGFAFSPDGRSLAALGNVDPPSPDATDYPGTVELLDLEQGTARSLGAVTLGPWSSLMWAP
jgi:hypothetical protein